MKIKTAKYLTSVTKKENIICDEKSEFAFVGRSNVGKSSLINALTGINGLAKTSSTPGLTKMINYFEVNGRFRLVDLPGYGYHKAGKANEKMWSTLMEDYLVSSPSLKLVFLLVDCRLEPSQLDKMMVKFLIMQQIPFMIVATKCDKLSKAQRAVAKKKIALSLMAHEDAAILFSSKTLEGKQAILDYIDLSA